MRDPAKVFTKSGLLSHQAAVHNLGEALFHFINNDDDLHISASEEGDQLMELIHKLHSKLESGAENFLLNGDGETDED